MKFKQNDKVEYDVNGMKGEAIICGIATNSLPVIGQSYILQDLSGNFPNDTYAYTHFAAFECWLKLI